MYVTDVHHIGNCAFLLQCIKAPKYLYCVISQFFKSYFIILCFPLYYILYYIMGGREASSPAPRDTVEPALPKDAELPELQRALLDDRSRALFLFPNAIPVTGLKHICDNLLGSVLQNIPQPLDHRSIF